MASGDRARPGSIAGASGDGGTEYRRGVAAYAVACGLAGASLPGVGVPPAHARVASVSLETDFSVDDIAITFDSGWRAFVQAKRTLNAGKPLKDAVAQWVHLVGEGLDPAKDRLVIVAGTLSEPMRQLRQVLERGRTDLPGSPTGGEADILAKVQKLLVDLDEADREKVLKCAVIWELKAEEADEPGSQQAIGHLRQIVADTGHDSARKAWTTLTSVSGRTARLRGGYRLAGWFAVLHGEGAQLTCNGTSPAAELETWRQARARYTARLIRRGSEIDLRMLGAELPAIAFDKADAGIKVSTNGSDDRDDRELIWAFLRRGRVILTGLPGGGKSVALKRLAAQLGSDPMLPLPVMVSLREVDALGSSTSFRDRIIAVAVREASASDRALLTAEIDERLDSDGGIALLFDSLDETYDRRAKVVSAVDDLVADLPEGVCIILATRDVAYGQAATLGWPQVRLSPPSTAENAAMAVLESAATAGMVDPSERADWIKVRHEWVLSALEKEEVLCETPLMPILLSLLAARKSTAQLPERRARILEAMVTDVVVGRELRRSDGRTLGPLNGLALDTAGIQAFTSEAAEIQNSQGKANSHSVVEAITADFRDDWGLPLGQARTAALEAVRVFDESGIFVLSGANEIVVPRIALFAEIGDAMHVVSRTEEIPTWVEARIVGRQFEPLVLACTLEAAVVSAAASALTSKPDQVALARALAQGFKEGAKLDDDTVACVCRSLIAHVEEGTREGWSNWEALLWLPVPADLRDSAEAAAKAHGAEHSLVARASFVLKYAPQQLDIKQTQVLQEVLALRSLPDRPSESTGTQAEFVSYFGDRTLTKTQLSAAELLLDHVPNSGSLVAERAIGAPSGLQKSLMRLLEERGFEDDVRSIHEETLKSIKSFKIPPLFDGYDDEIYGQFLQLVAEHPPAELSATQEARLHELAEFVTTLQLNDAGAVHLHKQDDDVLRELIELAATLYGFDRGILSSQAAIALERMEHWEGTDPYFALFDNSEERSAASWHAVACPDAAVRLLLRLFTLGVGQAWFAAKSLCGAPVADEAVPLLRALLPRLVSSTRHLDMAAMTLASITSGPEPGCWTNSSDPVLRAVAAKTVKAISGDAVSEQLQALLDDIDGHVQEAAIRRVVRYRPADLGAILDGVANRALPGWMCLSCRTVNPPPGPTSCSNDKCFHMGANPAKLALSFKSS